MTDGVFIAFLRGVNVGGKNKLPMQELAAIFGAAGCTDVRTFIQSGNVVCRASLTVAESLSSVIARAVGKRFGYHIPVVVRAAEALHAVARDNPFVAAGLDPQGLHVAFLAGEPRAGGVASLDVRRSPPDEFVVRGREIYLRLPNGVARSRLTNAYFDAALGTTSTIRNWRTLVKLVDLATSHERSPLSDATD